MKQFVSLFLTLFLSTLLFAQPGGMRPGTGGGAGMGAGQTGRMYGKIIDSASGKPLDAASVQLVSSKFDMATRQRKDTILTGMLTPANGDFSLENIPVMGDYRIRISAIGFKPLERKVSFLSPETQKKLMEAFAAASKQGGQPNMMEILKKAFGGDMSQLSSLGDKDLGNFKLQYDAKMLDNVTVTGNKPMMQMGIDRRIFNVDKNMAANGATALEIMRQVPTLNVDIDGNVTIRGTTPTLFIDGRPSTLTLEQIPADDIQSVELITNPSAKYDAAGGSASILNVVMKKTKRVGYNGSLRAGIDSRPRPNFGGDFSLRQNKVNFFASGSYNARKSLSWTDVNTAFKASGNNPATVIAQDIDNVSDGSFAFGRTGIDYFIDNRNTLTASFNFVRGSFNTFETNTLRYDTFYNPVKSEKGVRTTESDRMFRNLGSTLSFKHLFTKPGHELTADVTYSDLNSDGTSNFDNQMYDQRNNPKAPPTRQLTEGVTSSTFWVAQTDYTNKLSASTKIEGGLRAQVRKFTTLNDNYVYDINTNDFVLVPSVSSKFQFTDRVFAAYTAISGKAGKEARLGYNFGLRAESSDYFGTILTDNSKFNVKFPISLFPSAFLSYKLTEKSDIQANYSRRINRPNFFQLVPFIDFTDPLNLQVGNPGLKPEFTNGFELNYSQQFSPTHTLLVTSYFKHTDNLLTRYQYKDLNPITKDSAIYNTWINANYSMQYGVEFTSTNKFTKKFETLTNLNVYNATINSKNINPNLNNSQTSFFGKITLTQRLGKTNQWTLQMNADYQSRTVLPVGSGGRMMGGGGGGFMGGPTAAGSNGFVNPNYGVDFSIRRDIIKNKNGQGYAGSLTLSMNDIFRTRIYDATTSSDFFVQNLQRRRDPQVVRLQFNWRFGKFDASLFKRKNMKGEMEGMSEGMNMQ